MKIDNSCSITLSLQELELMILNYLEEEGIQLPPKQVGKYELIYLDDDDDEVDLYAVNIKVTKK